MKFCFKAGLFAKEILVLAQKAYENEALNLSNVFRWYSRFRDGRELVDEERSGCPKSTRTEVNIAADLVKNGRRIVSRIIAESLNIPKTVVLRTLKEDFCSQDFVQLHDNVPAHKATSVCKCLSQKMLQPFFITSTLPVLSRFISAKLFSLSQVEN
jgi:hypothetical protein